MASLKPKHDLQPAEAVSDRDLEPEQLSPLERAQISTLLPFSYVPLSVYLCVLTSLLSNNREYCSCYVRNREGTQQESWKTATAQ